MALLVHMPNNIVKFKKLSNGLYAMDLNNEKSLVLSKKVYQSINRLEENLKCRSPIQQNRENQAQEIYKVMANPTMDNLKGTI